MNKKYHITDQVTGQVEEAISYDLALSLRTDLINKYIDFIDVFTITVLVEDGEVWVQSLCDDEGNPIITQDQPSDPLVEQDADPEPTITQDQPSDPLVEQDADPEPTITQEL